VLEGNSDVLRKLLPLFSVYSLISSDVMLCTFVDRYQHFGGTGFKNDPDDGGSRPSDMLIPLC